MRKIARRDRNHAEVVRAFEAAFCTVLDLAQVGGGCPDLLVGLAGKNMLVEVKDGTKKPSARKLTPAQEEFWSTWRGAKRIVTSLTDVETVVSGLRSQKLDGGDFFRLELSP